MKKKITLGVTGSVAAIKTAQLAEGLSRFAEVTIVMTQHADYFVAPQREALQKLNITLYRDQDEWPPLTNRYELGAPILHIELRRQADLLLIAPLDANTLAKIAHGFCDNLLTSLVRAWDRQKPMLICPAMNTMMWENPPTEEHIHTLENRGATVIAPIAKKLACNDIGMGAMAEVGDIIQAVEWLDKK